ncbi:MAG: hypothetical protein M3R06_10780 [Chloroflexota bacterium]|nr:hypothetical protein [Chloroflexota bacterium]
MKARLPLAAFIFSSVVTFMLSVVGARDLREPQVILLDAGNGISALVVSEDARVLIASGNDPIALGNALASVRRLTSNRIDVLVDTTVGDSSFDTPARRTISLGDFPVAHGSFSQNRPATSLPNPMLLELPGDVHLEIATRARDASAATPTLAWRALIRSAGATVVVLSRSADAALFPTVEGVTAVVVSLGTSTIADLPIDTALIVVGATSSAGEGRRLREEVASTSGTPIWVDRLFPNQAIRLRFDVNGLVVPESAQLVHPTSGAS